VTKRFRPLLQFEMAKILLHDGRHRHTQGGSEILHCHCFLLRRGRQKIDQTLRQIVSLPGPVKIDRDIFPFRHLAEIREIGADDRHSIRARQVRDSAATGRG
jgi:hypothetical protein